MYSCLETITQEFYRDGKYCSQCSQGNWDVQHKENFSLALLNEILPTLESPTERKCSVLEAASHAALSRSPHTWLTSLSPLISFHSDKWITEINLQSDSKNFSREFFFKIKTRNLRFHSKRQTKMDVIFSWSQMCHVGHWDCLSLWRNLWV